MDHGGIASRAVDGNIDGTWGRKSVTHTKHGKGHDNWWQVDLQGELSGDQATWYIIIYHILCEMLLKVTLLKRSRH